jgi:hypothetical protein
MSKMIKIPAAGERFTALSDYQDIAGMGQYSHQMWVTFVVREDGSAVLDMGSPKAVLPARSVEQLFEQGRCGGLSPVTTLSRPSPC